jgi:hypothetical protein
MSEVSTTLQILVKLQDEATSAIQSLGGQVGSSFDQMAQKAREVGIVMVAAGAAITGALGYAVDQAAQDQTAWEGLNTTLSALQNTAKEDTSNKAQNSEQTQVLTAQAKALQAQIDQTRYSIEHSTTAHKDHAAAVDAGQAKIQLLQDKLDTVNNKLKTHQNELALATGNVQDWQKQIEEAAKANVDLGFNVDDTAASVQTLLNHTKDVSEALQLNNLAMDLARAKHIDLQQAASLVGLAYEGQGRALKQFGINIKDTATPMEALKELQQQVGGQAKEFTTTLSGQMDVMKAKQEELTVTIGNQLLPILTQLTEKVSDIIQKVLDWTNAHPQLTKTIVEVAAVAGPLLVLLGSFLMILPQLVAGINLVGAAFAFLAANPIVLIIAAIVALGLGIYELITHWQEVKDKTLEIWNGLSDNAKTWIRLILDILTLGMSELVIGVVKNWTTIQNTAKGVFGDIATFISSTLDVIKAVWNQDWTAISDFFNGIWTGITNSLQNAINWVVGQLNNLSNTVSNIAGRITQPIQSIGNVISNATKSVGNAVSNAIPHFASGGIVSSPTLALVGESGPEAIIPLSSLGKGGGGGNAASSGITIYLNGDFYTDQQTATKWANQIARIINQQLKLRTF